MSEERRVTFPNTNLAASLDAITGNRMRSRVLPPAPTPVEAERMEGYEREWGAGAAPEGSPPSPPDEPTSPGLQAPAPAPLSSFRAIDLTNMVVLGDNGEVFPIPPDATIGKPPVKLTDFLLRICRDVYAAALSQRLAALNTSLGLGGMDAKVPEMPADEAPPAVPKKRGRKRKA